MAATIGADLDGGFHCDMVRAGLALYGAGVPHLPGGPPGVGSAMRCSRLQDEFRWTA